jgi:hypothetical protein
MSEYDIAFGKRLSETAHMVASQGLAKLDAQRTVLYLSLLSTEITLKAMLEHAGMSVAPTHRLADLISLLGQCEVEIEIVPGSKRHVSASRIRAIPLNYATAQSTVGDVINAESHGASKYPNQMRYGEILKYFPAEVVAQMAAEVSIFAHVHWNDIRK